MTTADPQSPDPRPVAVLGLGAMGLEMATRLAKEFAVTGYDPSPGAAAQAAARGITLKNSPRRAVLGGHIIVLSVRTAEHARDALFGTDGAVHGCSEDTIVMLTSTIGAPEARQLAADLWNYRVAMLDLPVSGGPRRAGLGELLVFAGGSADILTRALPVVHALASRIAHAGESPGDGQSLKAVNQLLCGVHIAAAVEALTLAGSLGLNLSTVLDVLETGAAASFMLTDRGPRILQVLAGDTPDVRSRLDIFVKDMAIVLDSGRAGGVPTPVAAATEQLFRLAAAAGFGAQDDSATARLLLAPNTDQLA